MPESKNPARSLKQFVRDKKRANCSVCNLPEAILQEIRAARRSKVKYGDIVAWLAEVHRAKVTEDNLRQHAALRHEKEAR